MKEELHVLKIVTPGDGYLGVHYTIVYFVYVEISA